MRVRFLLSIPACVALLAATWCGMAAQRAVAQTHPASVTATAASNWWSFRVPVLPPVPQVLTHAPRTPGVTHAASDGASNAPNAWVRNPIDAFVLSKLQPSGLTPSREASHAVLIRRAYLDMTGLPPTPEEVRAFETDRAPDAWEKVVDRLLASPRYGERWGRHWLDLVRYADSGGFEGDKDRPLAWRYRDYVIDSFNADKPYDRFVREQIAGDELTPVTPESQIATGYLACGPVDIVMQNAKNRADELDDLVSTTGTVFLGLTVGCARCHDHKYDPIKQTDYYRLQALFAPSERREIEVPTPQDPHAKTLAVTDHGRDYPESHVMIRGDASHLGSAVKAGFICSLPGGDADVAPAPASATTTGRRRALAEWLVDPKNPLLARVWMNRVWRQHFGHGIVDTPSNFGMSGEKPSHPELLDWLAVTFIQGGWKLKPIHRMILLSATYRQESTAREVCMKRDPTNRLLWRMPVKRLEAEAIRDSILSVAGSLNLEMGGAPVYPPVDPSLRADTFQGPNWKDGADDATTWRRSVYVKVKRSLLLPELEVFDCPEITTSVAARNVSTTPTQALTLLNDPLILRQAGLFAQRLEKEVGHDPTAQIERGYLLALGRAPTAAERKLCLAFLQKRSAQTHASALPDLCHAIFNLNEFVYVP